MLFGNSVNLIENKCWMVICLIFSICYFQVHKNLYSIKKCMMLEIVDKNIFEMTIQKISCMFAGFSTSNLIFGRAAWEKLPGCIFENFDIARVKRGMYWPYFLLKAGNSKSATLWLQNNTVKVQCQLQWTMRLSS